MITVVGMVGNTSTHVVSLHSVETTGADNRRACYHGNQPGADM